MKPLTPFQKKVARWLDGLSMIANKIFVISIPFAIILAAFTPLYAAIVWGRDMWIPSCLLLLYAFFTFSAFLYAGSWIWRLPERHQKDAEKLSKDHPEFSGILQPFIQESVASDDGGKLAEKLEEINNFLSLKEKLASKKESFIELEKEMLSIKIEIAALEKELGMR